MIIGKFTKQGEIYVGSIYGIGFGISYVVFSPVTAKLSDSHPDFAIFCANSEDEIEFELGAAWAKTSKASKT